MKLDDKEDECSFSASSGVEPFVRGASCETRVWSVDGSSTPKLHSEGPALQRRWCCS